METMLKNNETIGMTYVGTLEQWVKFLENAKRGEIGSYDDCADNTDNPMDKNDYIQSIIDSALSTADDDDVAMYPALNS